ncbi:MAG: hypothetical protein ACK4UU_08250, partial [Fimbriimonadales bacterium]
LPRAFTLEVRGLIERDTGDWDSARRTLDFALQQRHAEADVFRLHFARTHRAFIGCKLGEPNARRELENCLAFWREQSNSPWIANTLLYLAEVHIDSQEWDAAQAALQEAQQLNR